MGANSASTILLANIYKMLGVSKCKGFCQAFCGAQFMSNTEYSVIPDHLKQPKRTYENAVSSCNNRERQFHECELITEEACEYLNSQGKCSIYEYRPVACRVWGSNNSTINKCPFGCVETVSDQVFEETVNIMTAIYNMDGTAEELKENG